MRKRSISTTFFELFKEGGRFHQIIELVKIDPYLDFELRGNSVMIYYRGGKILEIKEKGLEFVALTDNYYTEECQIKCPVPSIDNIQDYFSKVKYVVDYHEFYGKSKLGEKEFQQRIVYENNLSVNADNTDYFIADVEWEDDKLGGRADIVAFRWNHMEHKERKIQMTLIEVKQGEKAIQTKKGNKKSSAGLNKHYEDFQNLIHNKEYLANVRRDMYNVLIQKRDLGLIKGLEKLDKTSAGEEKIVEIDSQPEFLIALCNYHHYSDVLAIECEKLPSDCKFILSSFMGHGLYKDFIRTKEEMQKEFPNVILKK